MKLDWERVRLLIWLRKRQTSHSLARHGKAWGASLQHYFTMGMAALSLVVGLVAGYFVDESEGARLLAWDGWAALVCYLWLAALAAEAQRADPIDAGRILHLPVSMHEAFAINFVASLYSMPNIIGLAGAVGLAGGNSLHKPGSFVVLPVAVLFLLAVSAWVQVLRSWFLKVFRNPRRRRWLSIVAGLILALAGQLPNLVNLMNMQFSRSYKFNVAGNETEVYDPAWAKLPPGTVINSSNVTFDGDSDHPRIYLIPAKQRIYRVTYTKGRSVHDEGGGPITWHPNFWEVKDGVWRSSPPPPRMPGDGDIVDFPPPASHHVAQGGAHTRASEHLEGVPADLRDFWSYEDLHRSGSGVSRSSRTTGDTLFWHTVVPAGWPAWLAVSSVRGGAAIPFITALAGLFALIGLGLRQAWCIQRDAVLMTEKTPRAGAGSDRPARAVPWNSGTDKSASLARPLLFCSPAVSALARAFLRQWARSVEIRFQMIVACGLAGGAVGFGFFLWWTERGSAGAFHVVSSIVGLTVLAFMGLFLNFFGYDRGACRAMIIAPVAAREVLMAKNVAIGRLVLFTSLPFAAAAAVISREWLMSMASWLLLAPSAVLMGLALGNSSSVANPTPIRLGQRTQARPESGMGNGCLHVLIYTGVLLVLQIPQLLVAASAKTWVGFLAAVVVLASAAGIWRVHWRTQVLRLQMKFPEVADAVGKATDM
jgi:hypothetical protein